jgi:hypothetical protein
MDVGEFLQLMVRRWKVTVPALLVTAILTVAAFKGVHSQYESQVQMTMLNAPKITSQQGNYGNPYLAFDDALLVDTDLLTRYMASDSAAQQLQALGMTDQYTATIANNALGPFTQLTVTGTDKSHILQSMQTLIRFTRQRWLALQQASAAPPGSIVQLSLIAPPSSPLPVMKKKIEIVAGVAILGIIFSILLAVMVDSLLRRRRGDRPTSPAQRPERTRITVPMR